MHAILVFFYLFLLAPVLALPTRRQSPSLKKIIIDTDLLSFPDDVAALTLANVFRNMGDAEILGMASNVNYTLSVPAMDAINIHYGHNMTPYGQNRAIDMNDSEPGTKSVIIQNLTDSFGHDIKNGSDSRILSPVGFYQKQLSAAPDHSVTIISIGFLTNLAAFMMSNGGMALISSKVKELVVQGGHFDPASNHAVGYNLNVDFKSSLVLEHWPSNVTYIGGDLAEKVIINSTILQMAQPSPVKYAYELYRPNGSYVGLSADPLVVYYAVLGLGEFFVHGNKGGIIKITENTTNVRDSTAVIVDNPNTPENRWQYYLDFNPMANVTALATELTNLLVVSPPKPR